MENLPLIAYGSFGVHLLKNPAGTFSFFGTVPNVFCNKSWNSYTDGYQALIDWLVNSSVDFQKEMIVGMTPKLFQDFMNAK